MLDGLQASVIGSLEGILLLGALVLALVFRPWLPLGHGPLQNPWLAAMVTLPFLWWTQHLLPNGMTLHVTGACLLVLMFGWPLAMWSLLPVALASSLIQDASWPDLNRLVPHVVWMGVVPGSIALALGLTLRRWLPKHLFVYILGRGFIVTALAITLTGYLASLAEQRPDTLPLEDWMLGHWLLGWGEAISTGMLVAVFVAFKPHWLLTYSDQRYLPGKPEAH